jgi:hypothetical protein
MIKEYKNTIEIVTISQGDFGRLGRVPELDR